MRDLEDKKNRQLKALKQEYDNITSIENDENNFVVNPYRSKNFHHDGDDIENTSEAEENEGSDSSSPNNKKSSLEEIRNKRKRLYHQTDGDNEASYTIEEIEPEENSSPLKNDDGRIEVIHIQGSQADVEGGATACAVISVVGCLHYFRDNLLEPPKLPWEKAVKTGGRVWLKFKNRNFFQNGYDNGHITAVTCFNQEEFINANRYIEVIEEIGGSLDDKLISKSRSNNGIYFTLEQAIDKVISFKRDTYCVFSIRGLSSSIMIDSSHSNYATTGDNGDDTSDESSSPYYNQKRNSNTSSTGGGRKGNKKIWLFDSHGNIKPGHSTLLGFKDKYSLITYLREKYPLKQARSASWNFPSSAEEEVSLKNTFDITVFGEKNVDN